MGDPKRQECPDWQLAELRKYIADKENGNVREIHSVSGASLSELFGYACAWTDADPVAGLLRTLAVEAAVLREMPADMVNMWNINDMLLGMERRMEIAAELHIRMMELARADAFKEGFKEAAAEARRAPKAGSDG